MSRRLPPFAAVRAFEAAAKAMSFKAAAAELCLSPSAVSHQIRGLEDYLDTKLFERDGNRLRLTLTGEGYASRLTFLLDDLDQSTAVARGRYQEAPLRVLCTPGFAARFMMPRLGNLPFSEEIRLRVSEGAPLCDFSKNDADVVIHWGASAVPGAIVEPLMESLRYPVAAPEFIARHGISAPSDLLKVPLMYDEVMDAWGEWFRLAGVKITEMPHGPVFPNCELATTAAEQGQGIALAYDAMVRDTVKSGRLVRLFDTVTMPIVIYSVAYHEARVDEPRIRQFRDWIFTETFASGRGARSGAVAAE